MRGFVGVLYSWFRLAVALDRGDDLGRAGRAYRRFWFEYEIPRVKLALFRIAFFGVLAVDAFLRIEHAPRYGAGGFNVSHLPWLDGVLPLPSREGVLMLALVQCYLAVLVAFGIAPRLLVRMLAGLYGYTIFISQLDSYQHHYLVFLILVVLSFVPWERTEEEMTRKGPDEVKSWALRLVLVQMAVVYFWAAVTKMDPLWTDGTALQMQLQDADLRDLVQSWFGKPDADGAGGFATVALLVLLGELVLAGTVAFRKMWWVALPLGIAFHAGVELAGFQIGIFSYFMFALYLLLIPDRWFRRGARGLRPRLEPYLDPVRRLGARVAAVAVALGVALAGAALLVVVLPFDETWIIAAVIAGIGVALVVAAAVRDTRVAAQRRGIASAAACVVLVLLYVASDQGHNYYKYWGGSARRLGDGDGARHAYAKLTEVSPTWGSGHYHRGRYLLEDGDVEQAMKHFKDAQFYSPNDPRPFVAEARIHAREGRGKDAYVAALQALAVDPDNREALALRARYRDAAE